MDAVGADQERAVIFAGRIAVLVDETGCDAVCRLAPVLEVMSGEDVVAPDARAGGIEQELQEDAAVDRELRPFIAGLQPARFRPDLLAVLGEVGELLGSHGGGVELVEEAELDQLAARVRQDVDADADRLELGDALENPDLDANLVQAERDGEPGNAAAGHKHGHGIPLYAVLCGVLCLGLGWGDYSPDRRGLATFV